MAKVLAGLFAAGAMLALLTVLLPHSRQASEPGLLAVIATACLVAGVLYRRSSRLPEVALPLALVVGSTLITCVAYFSAQTPSPLVFFYLWVVLYSSYFLTLRQMVAQVAYTGLAYMALLLARPPTGGVPAWWLVVMGRWRSRRISSARCATASSR